MYHIQGKSFQTSLEMADYLSGLYIDSISNDYEEWGNDDISFPEYLNNIRDGLRLDLYNMQNGDRFLFYKSEVWKKED